MSCKLSGLIKLPNLFAWFPQLKSKTKDPKELFWIDARGFTPVEFFTIVDGSESYQKIPEDLADLHFPVPFLETVVN